MSVPHSVTGCFVISSISPLFMDRFGGSIRFCHLDFDKDGISEGKKGIPRGIRHSLINIAYLKSYYVSNNL